MSLNHARVRHLAERAIRTFGLDLDGLDVLTEAATGYYVFGPHLCALAGARRVFALTRDSRWGDAVTVRDLTMALAERWGVADRIQVLVSRDDERVGEADIVTNSGFVRPLDESFLGALKRTAVIPLMFETWEHRDADLDLAAARRLGIPVLGTNEQHPELQVFDYLGHVATKLLFELEIEVFRARVVVGGTGPFADTIVATLGSAGAEVLAVDLADRSTLLSERVLSWVRDADALVIAEHQNRDVLLGPTAAWSADGLARLNGALAVAHICGGVDVAELEASGLARAPASVAPAGYMSVRTDFVGPRPLVDLFCAGLKVGEAMARQVASGLRGLEVERIVLAELDLAQGFAGVHDQLAPRASQGVSPHTKAEVTEGELPALRAGVDPAEVA